jgi:hypothetical protein
MEGSEVGARNGGGMKIRKARPPQVVKAIRAARKRRLELAHVKRVRARVAARIREMDLSGRVD